MKPVIYTDRATALYYYAWEYGIKRGYAAFKAAPRHRSHVGIPRLSRGTSAAEMVARVNEAATYTRGRLGKPRLACTNTQTIAALKRIGFIK